MAPNPLIQRLYTLNVPPEPKPNFIISAKTTRAANISRSPTMSPASSVYNPNQENEDPQDHRPLGTLGGGCIAPETLINPFLGPRTLPTAPYSREGHFRVVPLLPLGTNGDQSAAITTGLASFRLMSPYSSDPYGIAELAVECDKLDISGPDDRMMALRRVPPNYRFFPTSNPSLEGYGYSPYAGPGPLNGAPTLSNTGTPDGRGSSQRTIGKDFMDIVFQANPTDVFLIYDRRKQLAGIDRELLCSHSKYFTAAFVGQPNARRRSIRLRGDFPIAVKAMLRFVAVGWYTLEHCMLQSYPYLTMLDLHVHTYILSQKYDMYRLREHAIDEYVEMAHKILSGYIGTDIPKDMESGTIALFVHNIYESLVLEGPPPRPLAEPFRPGDHRPIAEANRFLNSVVLLWKNTASSEDTMRKVVIGLAKHYLPKISQLRFFNTMLTGLDGFSSELAKSLAEDEYDLCLREGGSKDRYVLSLAQEAEKSSSCL